MTELIILLTAILFYYIGKYSSTQAERNVVESVRSNALKAIKIKNKPKAGALPVKTLEDLEYERSGQKAIEDHQKKIGVFDVIKRASNAYLQKPLPHNDQVEGH